MLLLIEALSSETSNLKQIWYADDATAAGQISSLNKWWDKLSLGPSNGYFVYPTKSWLVTKDDHLLTASALFGDTSVNITFEGRGADFFLGWRQHYGAKIQLGTTYIASPPVYHFSVYGTIIFYRKCHVLHNSVQFTWSGTKVAA